MSYMIALTQDLYACIDEQDLDVVQRHRWYPLHVHGTCYAQAHEQGKSLLMHRLIMPAAMVDHRDHNGLNNQRSNLRSCSASENNAHRRKIKHATTSRFKGVDLLSNGRWRSRIAWQGQHMSLGNHDTEQAAALAYNAAAVRYHGEFACLNEV